MNSAGSAWRIAIVNGAWPSFVSSFTDFPRSRLSRKEFGSSPWWHTFYPTTSCGAFSTICPDPCRLRRGLGLANFCPWSRSDTPHVSGQCLCLTSSCVPTKEADATTAEPVAVGIAYTAAHGWDEPAVRPQATRLLCQLIPHAAGRVIDAIGTVFWAEEDFPADSYTEMLLQTLAAHPNALGGRNVTDLVAHLAKLLPHLRRGGPGGLPGGC